MTQLAACGIRKQTQKLEKCNANQNKQIFSRQQDNVNSNTTGKRLTKEASKQSQGLIKVKPNLYILI